MTRIEDLTIAIKECDEVSEDEEEDSSTESVTSDTEITDFPLDSPLVFGTDGKKTRSFTESLAWKETAKKKKNILDSTNRLILSS